jgi:hypothetical protein
VKNGDDEAEALLINIEDTLKDASWIQRDWTGSTIVLNHPNRSVCGPDAGVGIVIEVNPEDEPTLWEAASALSTALLTVGIVAAAKLDAETLRPNMNKHTIHVFVGQKPI